MIAQHNEAIFVIVDPKLHIRVDSEVLKHKESSVILMIAEFDIILFLCVAINQISLPEFLRSFHHH